MTLQTLLHLAVLGKVAVAAGATDRGVSETIGVLIIVLLTILVAGVIGLSVLGEQP